MLSEVHQRVATLQLGSSYYIVIFAALSSAMLKCKPAFRIKIGWNIFSKSKIQEFHNLISLKGIT